MKNLLLKIAIILSVISFSVFEAYSQGQITVYPSKDAYVKQVPASGNYNSEQLKLGNDPQQYPNNYHYVCLKFDLPQGISANDVLEARLFLTFISGNGTLDTVRGLYITSNWEEDQINLSWLLNNADYTPFAIKTNVSGELEFPLTEQVKDWIDNPSSNHGFALITEDGSEALLTYYDKENGVGEQRPRIIIDTVVTDVNESVKTEIFEFYEIYPNPINSFCIIRYNLMAPSIVSLKITNVLGKEIEQITSNTIKQLGKHELMFDSKSIPNGFYYITLQAGYYKQTKIMLIQR